MKELVPSIAGGESVSFDHDQLRCPPFVALLIKNHPFVPALHDPLLFEAISLAPL